MLFAQLVKKYSAFYGTLRFIPVFTRTLTNSCSEPNDEMETKILYLSLNEKT
jgi:hypothetical protein